MTAKSLSPQSIPTVLDQVAADGNHPESRVVRIVARSPATRTAREIMQKLADLHTRGIDVKAVFLNIPNKGPGSAAMRKFAEIFGADKVASSVRVAAFPGSGDLLEQVNFGRVGVWTGKPLKAIREAAPEEGTYAETTNNQKLAKMARGAFVSAWAISHRMSKSELRSIGIEQTREEAAKNTSKAKSRHRGK